MSESLSKTIEQVKRGIRIEQPNCKTENKEYETCIRPMVVRNREVASVNCGGGCCRVCEESKKSTCTFYCVYLRPDPRW